MIVLSYRLGLSVLKDYIFVLLWSLIFLKECSIPMQCLSWVISDFAGFRDGGGQETWRSYDFSCCLCRRRDTGFLWWCMQHMPWGVFWKWSFNGKQLKILRLLCLLSLYIIHSIHNHFMWFWLIEVCLMFILHCRWRVASMSFTSNAFLNGRVHIS